MKKKEKVLSDNENPYLNARREWNERYGNYIVRERNWQRIAFLSMSVALLCVIGLIYMGSQNKLVPYIVEVDKFGRAENVGYAQQIQKRDPIVIRAVLAEFITNFRSVTTDKDLQKQMIFNLYTHLSKIDPATEKINYHFRDKNNNPLARGETVSVSVEIRSILQLTSSTWEVEWTETETKKSSDIKKQMFRAVASIAFMPPSEDTALKNPLGLYVREFNWTKQLSEKGSKK